MRIEFMHLTTEWSLGYIAYASTGQGYG